MTSVEPETLIAVDPGASGGYCTCPGSLRGTQAYSLKSPSDFVDHMHELVEMNEGRLRGVVEDVPPFCGVAVPSHTSFKLGRSFGLIEGVFRGLKIPYELISPRGPKGWQAGLTGLRKLKGSERKRALRDHASRLFPELKPTLATADALLIAWNFYKYQPKTHT